MTPQEKLILIDFKLPINTKCLKLYAPVVGDGAKVNEAILETYDELKRWVLKDKHPPSVEDTELSIREKLVQFINRSTLNFYGYKNGKFILSVDIHNIHLGRQSCELGYWCRKSESGKGLMVESVKAITEFCFEHLYLKKVSIIIDSRNINSIRVAERSGFLLEAEIVAGISNLIDSSLAKAFVYSKFKNTT